MSELYADLKFAAFPFSVRYTPLTLWSCLCDKLPNAEQFALVLSADDFFGSRPVRFEQPTTGSSSGNRTVPLKSRHE